MAERRSVYFWKEQIGKWKSSGYNQSEYCRQNNLNGNSFSKWKIKFSEQEKLSMSDFLRVELAGVTESTEIEFVFKENFKFRLKSDFNRELLKNVLEIIGEVKK